jgi:hypothetical protein
MPLAPEHRQKRVKNLALLGVLLGVAGLFFALTLFKMTP